MESHSSSPSEGEIVESDSDKATTEPASYKGTSIDRPSRIFASDSRSVSRSKSPWRRNSRSKSRSPYREPRTAKRSRDDDHYDRSRNDPRRFKVRYEDYPTLGKPRARQHEASEVSADRSNFHEGRDYNDRLRETRPKTRSRSPLHPKVNRQNHEQSNSQARSGRRDRGARIERGDRGYVESRSKLSIEQSVRDRGYPSVAAVQVMQDAESQNHQTQLFDNPNEQPNQALANIVPAAEKGTIDGASRILQLDEAALIEERRKKREAIKAKYRGQRMPLMVQSLTLDSKSVSSILRPQSTEDEHQIPGCPMQSPIPASQIASGHESPTEFVVSKDTDLANGKDTASETMQEDEPSAADYDPTMDMEEDKIRHDHHQRKDEVPLGAYDEIVATKQDVLLPGPSVDGHIEDKEANSVDMFADNDDYDMFADGPATNERPTQGFAKAVPVPQPKPTELGMLDDWDDPEGYYKVILGELLDKQYQVQSNLGKGMFSGVVRAVDQDNKRLVAIKLIRNNETMMKAGLKEIEILEKLALADPEDKKHIIKFERYFGHKGHLCMVFENLSINLREVLKKFGRDVGINLKAVRAYAQQMFLGLSLLRKCNVLHADIKPDNILVNDTRNVLKICDLGSASDASENEITQYLVSRFYRAPEIILGMPYDYGIDIWSIGCTLFELYTGKILFTGRSNNQMLRAIMECRGKFSHKMLRKAEFASYHFDDLLNFRSIEKDKLTGKDVIRILNYTKPARDLKTRLTANLKGMDDYEVKELNLFVDLMDRCLHLNPEKRCTAAEALRHPFILKTKG